MIKKIQADTGAKVQFINLNEDTPDDRRCLITGNPDQVADAKQRIESLVDSALVSIFSIHFISTIIVTFFHSRIEVVIDQVEVTSTEIKVGEIVAKLNH